MAEPVFTVINVEEKPDKIVGIRRHAPKDAFKAGMILQTANDLRRSLGQRLVPKGVFHFRTQEEAAEWMLRMLARHSRKS